MDEIKRIVLARHCDGPPDPEDFALDTSPVPELREGQFLVRHIWASVDPGTRSRLSGTDSYAGALPLGKPIDGFNAGVVDASMHPDWPVGTKVFCAGGWRTHSIQTGKGFIGTIPDAPVPLSYWIGVLGVPGLTAWFGLNRVGAFKEGDRVLVTSAAGPVGATAGQLAKLGGAARVAGVAGGPVKCGWLRDEAGFDAVVDYKSSRDLSTDIAKAMPEGVDVLFDNVGNAMIDRILPMMRPGGRIVVSGQVADYNVDPRDRDGIKNTAPFITHRVRMEGLVVFDDARDFPKALGAMAEHIAKGELKVREERFEGVEAMPEAFCGLFRGENFGRRVVKVGEE
ncbi:MAG: NADP-dependent oxidoreductase [Pseudomonadota bacterium]